MRIIPLLAAISAPILLSSVAIDAYAQTPPPDVTPRQVFTSFATGIPLADLKFKPIGGPVNIINTLPGGPVPVPATPVTPAAPKPVIPVLPVTKSADNPTTDIMAPPTVVMLEDAEAETLTPTQPKTEDIKEGLQVALKPAARTKSRPDAVLLPFYVSADDYLETRGGGKTSQLKLRYQISINSPKSTLTTAPTSRQITLGPDFVVVEEDKKTRIFDFKMNRLLTLHSSDNGTIFDNISLYSSAFKNVNTVSSATQNGKKSSVAIGPDSALDAFWLEASLGWAARGKFESLNVAREGATVTSTYKSFTPFSADLSGPKIPTEDHMRAMFAWWHHDLPIHPAILPEIGRPDNAPKSMEIVSFSPKFPDGLTATWTLTDSKVVDAGFPLPKTARTSVEAQKSSPLACVISEAASGQALKQRPTPGDLRQEILEKREAGKNFEAWLTAQMLADRLGGCDVDPALLCQDISDLESRATPESDLAKLPKIIQHAKASKTRVAAFEALYPYVSGEIAPAFLVKIAGQTRARIKSSALTSPEHQALKADHLLEEALVKNPYDPDIYLTLAQVYAAQGQMAESWDIQDALRRLPDVTDKHTAAIIKAERTLRARAPGFFHHATP